MPKAKTVKKGTRIGNWYVTHALVQIGNPLGHEGANTTNFAETKKAGEVEAYALANHVTRLGPQYVAAQDADGSWGVYRVTTALLRSIFGQKKARFVVQTEKQLAREAFSNAQLHGPEIAPLVERL